ncbi:MAG: putative bifunctional diguanylate cyclase/phosphodiesterase [Candidatus Marinarcus sp.]|uniref:putative bifunctional diguanylate cyclase/phosphodiesterase n=1 Tax=Candidatus Marinarcus sp. TaxID=3100987 RepID=UPI003AFFB2C1
MIEQDEIMTNTNLTDFPPKLWKRLLIIVFGLLAFISYVALVSFNLIQAKERELETAHEQQTSLSKILVSHAEATLKKIDTALLSVQLQLSGKSEKLRPEPLEMNAILASHLALIGESQSLRVANAQGRFIYDASGILHSATINDRDYFLRNRANTHGELVISKPLFARITHNWVVTLSRPITDEKGEFAGLIQAAVRAEYFQNMYASLDMGATRSITLFDDKLRMLARFPAKDEQLGRPINSSFLRDFIKNAETEKNYTTISAVDGIERHYMTRKVGEYPLYIVVGHTTEDQLSQWYQELYWSIAGVVVLGGALFGLIIVWLNSYDSALALAKRMTSAYKETVERIQHIAEHDSLTDLPNRIFLEQHMTSIIAKTIGRRVELVLMFLDLDHFKDVNDTLGHAVGDKLLIQVAERLQKNLNEEDTISREGGDEFTVLLKGYSSLAHVAETAKRLIEAIKQPFLVDNHEFMISASIGISVYPQDGADIMTLLKNADTAMYQAKSDGGGKFHFFNEEMNTRVLNRVAMITNLRQALEHDEFVLHYQPQVDGVSGRIIGVEALIRWYHPEQGIIPPLQFIPAAEESGLINVIGDWVLKQACTQLKQWMDLGLREITMAVNISAVQLRQSDFMIKVLDAMSQSKIPAHCLELEITESALIRDTQRIVSMLEELRDNGIRLSVDDFGTGYSSFGYLKNLPFDKIKIDQSFVRELPESENDASIIQAIIGVANSLKMELIAEGVETQKQREFLLNQKCQQMQGYYFGKPVSASEMEELLRQGIE